MIDDGSLRELVSRGADPISGRVVDLESRVIDRAERLARRRPCRRGGDRGRGSRGRDGGLGSDR